METASILKRLDRVPQFLRFFIVGGINTAVDFSIFLTLVLQFGLDSAYANTASYLGGVGCSYVLNRLWTFSDRAKTSRTGRQILLFLLINLVTLTVSTSIIELVESFGPVLAAKIAATFVGIVINYAGAKYIVFTSDSLRPIDLPPIPAKTWKR